MSKPTIKKLEKSRVEITGSVPAKTFDGYRAQAIERLGQTVKVDGFRPGHIPANVLEKHVGEAGILDEMAQLAILNAYPEILTAEKIQAIGRPEIQITKIAMGNDLEFKIVTAVLPTIKLGDYKKIATSANKSAPEISVTDQEIDQSIKEIRQMRAHHQMHEDGVDHHDHNHANIPDEQLPALDDEFVKTLGAFESVEDFKTKLRENIANEKMRAASEKRRIEIIDGIIESSSIDLPDLLVDVELDKMMQQFVHDISMMGMTFEDYLKRIEKSEDSLKSEWRVNAEKRAKMQMILDEIGTHEKIAPTDDEVQSEVAKILDMYKDQKDISEDRVRAYVTQILANAKVFDYLEGLK